MTDKTEDAYKGYTIRIVPRKEYCSNFALVILNDRNEEIKHIAAAGETEEDALARGREVIDFESAYARERGTDMP
jgi:hypothetical protein